MRGKGKFFLVTVAALTALLALAEPASAQWGDPYRGYPYNVLGYNRTWGTGWGYGGYGCAVGFGPVPGDLVGQILWYKLQKAALEESRRNGYSVQPPARPLSEREELEAAKERLKQELKDAKRVRELQREILELRKELEKLGSSPEQPAPTAPVQQPTPPPPPQSAPTQPPQPASTAEVTQEAERPTGYYAWYINLYRRLR